MITVEIRDADQAAAGMAQVEVFCDSEGLSMLIKQLEFLRAGSTHVHLMTPAWAGTELAEKPLGQGTVLVNHLRVTMVHG